MTGSTALGNLTSLWQLEHCHINEKEIIAVVIAAHRWAPLWSNYKVIFFSDNAATVASINKCSSKNATLMACLRSLFWLSATYNFRFVAQHVPGLENTCADFISRLHEKQNFLSLLGSVQLSCMGGEAAWWHHISFKTLFSLLNRHVPSLYRYLGHTGPTTAE
jgi:hypothetical protein